MLETRLIPVLLVDGQGHLVKTISFSDRNYLGDPLNAAYVFSGFEVDELIVLDIDATPNGRSISPQFVESLASFARVPLCVGGGIHTLEQIHELLSLGVEKVALSAFLDQDFSFLRSACERFGSSTISVVLNCLGESQMTNEVSATKACFGRPDLSTNIHSLLDIILACQESGAGELILNHVERDGTRVGYASDAIAAVNARVTIPVVALGGCGKPQHLSDMLQQSRLSGLAAGSLFVYASDTSQVLLNYTTTNNWLKSTSLK